MAEMSDKRLHQSYLIHAQFLQRRNVSAGHVQHRESNTDRISTKNLYLKFSVQYELQVSIYCIPGNLVAIKLGETVKISFVYTLVILNFG